MNSIELVHSVSYRNIILPHVYFTKEDVLYVGSEGFSANGPKQPIFAPEMIKMNMCRKYFLNVNMIIPAASSE